MPERPAFVIWPPEMFVETPDGKVTDMPTETPPDRPGPVPPALGGCELSAMPKAVMPDKFSRAWATGWPLCASTIRPTIDAVPTGTCRVFGCGVASRC